VNVSGSSSYGIMGEIGRQKRIEKKQIKKRRKEVKIY